MRIWQRPKNKKKNKSGEMRPVGGRVLPDSCVFLTKTYDLGKGVETQQKMVYDKLYNNQGNVVYN